MTFLELVQKAVLYAPIPGNGPASAIDTSGESRDYQLIASWVQQAWQELQNSRRDWKWMQKASQFSTTTGQNIYSLDQIGAMDPDVLRLRRWYRHDFRYKKGDAEDRPIPYMPEWQFERRYSNAVPDSTGHPIQVAVRERDLALWFYPVPDDVYPVHMRYATRAQAFTADTDVPDLPSEYHDLIVYMAVERWARYHNAPERVTASQNESTRMYGNLVTSQTTELVLADEPLA